MSQRSSNCGCPFGPHHVVSPAAAPAAVDNTTGSNLLTRIDIH